MNTRKWIPLLAFLPALTLADEAQAQPTHDVRVGNDAAPGETRIDPSGVVGSWTIVADQGGCERVVTLSAENVLRMDGGGIGSWMVHGNKVQIAAQHAKVAVAETGLAKTKHVGVRWTGALRKGPKGTMLGELLVEVLDDNGEVKSSRRVPFTAKRS